MLSLITCNIACLTIAALYYAYRDVYVERRRRSSKHHRVAYMLWVAAGRAG